MDITYRRAAQRDCTDIAMLHVSSWKNHYHGIVRDTYLDEEVEEERKTVWQQRFKLPPSDQIIILAEARDQLCGFACVYAHRSEEWGAYLDNLHVLPAFQGYGIGRELIQRSAQAVHAFDDSIQQYYLWVFEKNHAAISFYEHNGGELCDRDVIACPDGQSYPCIRYSWKVSELL